MALKNIIQSNKGIRKIFGRKEIEIILKQLDGFYLTPSERNRLSRDIRPKLKIIKELARFEDEFELKKDLIAQRTIEKAVAMIQEDKLRVKIKAILLFGSHVKGVITARSDIDVCVVFDDITRTEADRFRIRILGNFDTNMDIQAFNTLPQKIKRDIARNHKVLYKSADFNNMDFTIRYLKDEDYFIRMERIFGEVA